MDDYEVREVTPGRYEKYRGDKIIGEASLGEYLAHGLKSKCPEIDTGILEVSLALAAVAALMTSGGVFTVKLFGAVAFVFSLFAALYLYKAYFIVRIPRVLNDFYSTHSVERSLMLMLIWALFKWPIQEIFKREKDSFIGVPELGYIFLFWGILLVGSAAGFFVLQSLF
jgi:hypothetical protein